MKSDVGQVVVEFLTSNCVCRKVLSESMSAVGTQHQNPQTQPIEAVVFPFPSKMRTYVGTFPNYGFEALARPRYMQSNHGSDLPLA